MDDFVFSVINQLTAEQRVNVQGLADAFQRLTPQNLAMAGQLLHNGEFLTREEEMVDEASELLNACREHQWDMAFDVMGEEHIDGKLRDLEGNTALHYTLTENSEVAREVAGELLARFPACVTIANNNGVTPLHLASALAVDTPQSGLVLVETLLNMGADVNAEATRPASVLTGPAVYSSPLITALRSNSCELAELLLKHGAALVSPTDPKRNPIACVHSVETLKLCAAYDPGVIQHVDVDRLVRSGKHAMIGTLLDLGFHPYRLDEHGVNWLHRTRDPSTVKAMMQRGLDYVTNPKSAWGDLPPQQKKELNDAVSMVMDEFVSAGLNMDPAVPPASALVTAVRKNAVDQVAKHMPAGGWTPSTLAVVIGGRPTTLLHVAVEWHAAAVLAYLCNECGPDVCSMRGPCGRTPLQAAVARNWKAAMPILLSGSRKFTLTEAACTAVSQVALSMLPLILPHVDDANPVVEAWFAAPVPRLSPAVVDAIVRHMGKSPPLRFPALRAMLCSRHAATLGADIDRLVSALGMQLSTSEVRALQPPSTSPFTTKLFGTYGKVSAAALEGMILDAASPGMLKRLLALGASPPMDCCAQCRVRRREGLMRCSRCKCVVYCDEAHQRQHWPKHSKVCAWWAAEGIAMELGSLLQVSVPADAPGGAGTGASKAVGRGKRKRKKKRK